MTRCTPDKSSPQTLSALGAGCAGPLPRDVYGSLELAIETWPLGRINGYHRNARTHTKAQIAQIASSIGEFGFVAPVQVDENGTLIAGHGRVAALKLLGRKTVSVICLSHLNEAQKRALRLADNKIADLAGFDEELLALEFGDLLDLEIAGELSFDLTVTGFASAEVDRLVDLGRSAAGASEGDAIEAPRDAAVARLGDVFELGQHRIICGDARDETTYEALLGGERAAMSISDAPYNVSIEKHVSKSGKHDEFVMGVGEFDVAGFILFLAAFLELCKRFSHAAALHYAFMDWRHMAEMLAAGDKAGLALKNLCVWDKGTGAMGSLYRSQHELVFLFNQPGVSSINNVQLGAFGRNRTNVWAYPGAAGLRKELQLHPTPKPVALVADAIRDASNRNDIVLDAFSGSGTTIIAAAKTGRRARVIELDPRYVDVAIRRWEARSENAARHVATGATFAELAATRLGAGPPDAEPVLSVTRPPVRLRRRADAVPTAAE